MKRYKTVEEFLGGAKQHQEELVRLREILISTALEESVKWGSPCYSYQGKNLVGIGSFKSYFGLWFFQGALLADKNKVLINAQEGTTKAMRQWRMESSKEIKPRVIKSYVAEAIKLVELGKEIKPDRNKTLNVPDELVAGLKKNKKAETAFKSMKPGKQREYAEFIAMAKRTETKQARLAKILPMITAGMGLNDKYRNC